MGGESDLLGRREPVGAVGRFIDHCTQDIARHSSPREIWGIRETAAEWNRRDAGTLHDPIAR